MRALLLSGDAIGGAARATLRLHNALTSNSGINSTMIVRQKINDDWRITQPYESRLANACGQILPLIDRLPVRFQHCAQAMPRSPAWVSAICARKLNQSDADVINLHWICSGFLSIEEIGKITKPVVWTLHDMWAFCGAEHLASDDLQARWRVGYCANNRPTNESGIDVDRWVWRRKQKAWLKPMQIITPSAWLADCVRSSVLMRNWDVTVIPNVLDTSKFKPIPKAVAREVLGLPLEGKLIIFGAIRGTQLPYKGWDLLQSALAIVSKKLPGAQALIFGQGEPKYPPSLGMPLHWMGHVHDDATLALLYSAADVVVVPSRQENLPQLGTEAHACGCPVVAFNVTGLKDVVKHSVTGYLAEPYSIDDLANGIEWVLADDERHLQLSAHARERAVRLWSREVVVPQYQAVYQRTMEVLGG